MGAKGQWKRVDLFLNHFILQAQAMFWESILQPFNPSAYVCIYVRIYVCMYMCMRMYVCIKDRETWHSHLELKLFQSSKLDIQNCILYLNLLACRLGWLTKYVILLLSRNYTTSYLECTSLVYFYTRRKICLDISLLQ